MQTCPQCQNAFPDDYVYCLNDGTSLLAASGEQPTLMRPKVFSGETAALSPDMLVACPTCSLANRANSKFCKKCGNLLSGQPVGQATPGQAFPNFAQNTAPSGSTRFGAGQANPQSSQDQTIAFQTPVFTPPGGHRSAPTQNQGRNNQFLMIAVLAGVVAIGGAVIYSSQRDGDRPTATNNSNTNRAANRTVTSTSNSAYRQSNAAPDNSGYSTSVIGRTGRLRTNQRIRSASNKNAQIVGVHYLGAKVEILDTDSYDTEDGPTTWYRVRVLENGCDREGVMGCGNDLDGYSGAAAMEGWMNGKFINLE